LKSFSMTTALSLASGVVLKAAAELGSEKVLKIRSQRNLRLGDLEAELARIHVDILTHQGRVHWVCDPAHSAYDH
jgi:hypothetical protein